MRTLVFLCLLVPSSLALARVTEVPIESKIDLKPGETRTITIKTSEPMEIGWIATQAKPCTTHCIEVTEKATGQWGATSIGGRRIYAPVDGKIALSHRNTSTQLVTITVYRVERTCESESCAFLKGKKEGHSLVIKVGAFNSITTSKDGSYSVVTGVTAAGKPFKATLLWWTDEPESPVIINCSRSIQEYVDKKAPPESYSPYILPGTRVGDGPDPVLKSFTGCVATGTKYGVDEDSVYR